MVKSVRKKRKVKKKVEERKKCKSVVQMVQIDIQKKAKLKI